MSGHGRIVVGVDGSESSKRALRWALAEAALRDVELAVVQALWPHFYVPPYGPTVTTELLDRYEQVVKRDLATAIAEASAATALPHDRAIEVASSGNATEVLVAESTNADLLVVGARGHGGFAALRLGSVSYGCVRQAHCPVTVVPAAGQPTGDAAPSSPYDTSKVIVGIDGSDGAAGALRWAVEEAKMRKEPVEAVLAWHLLDQLDHNAGEPIRPGRGQSDAEAGLDEFIAANVATADQSLVKAVAVCDIAARALLKRANTADLLVVGSRGLSRLAAWALGSVSDHVVRHSRCPVVVVRELAHPGG